MKSDQQPLCMHPPAFSIVIVAHSAALEHAHIVCAWVTSLWEQVTKEHRKVSSLRRGRAHSYLNTEERDCTIVHQKTCEMTMGVPWMLMHHRLQTVFANLLMFSVFKTLSWFYTKTLQDGSWQTFLHFSACTSSSHGTTSCSCLNGDQQWIFNKALPYFRGFKVDMCASVAPYENKTFTKHKETHFILNKNWKNGKSEKKVHNQGGSSVMLHSG